MKLIFVFSLVIKAVTFQIPHFELENEVISAPIESPNDFIKFINCGRPNDMLRVDSLEITPYPPLKGQKVTVSLKANVNESFSFDAGLVLQIKKGKLVLKTFRENVCELLSRDLSTPQCPLSLGPKEISVTEELPGVMPRGNYGIEILAKDGNKQMACIKFDLSM